MSTTNPNNSNKNKFNYGDNKTDGPYRGWKLYFTEEVFMAGNITHNKIQAVENYIAENSNLFSFNTLLENRSANIDIKLLNANKEFVNNWPNFLQDLNENPEHTIACINLAMHQTICRKSESDVEEYVSELNENEQILLPPTIRLRVINHEPITQLKYLKVHLYGKLVTVRGTIIRCSPRKLLCKWLTWKCDHCSNVQVVYQTDGRLTPPTSCSTKLCRSKKFCHLLSHVLTRTIDWQTIKLQETITNHQIEGGRVPRAIEVELTEDLVNSCIPGDDVTITGVLKVLNENEGNGGRRQNSTTNMFLLYIDAVSVINDKNHTSNTNGKNSVSGIEFSIKDYYAIQKIHAEENLLQLLVHSLCPSIFGHEIVKLGLLLGLFSCGLEQQAPDSRSNSHILIVGDPGLGKSQLLQACANVSPRGVYVCGNTSTSAGLTVSLIRDSGGDFAMEAGALVLADRGICCIDEFDKMSTQHQALLEAMEQQTISVAKGGVVCTLSARCGILAAANPRDGHYNKGKTIAENINLKSALLSRFDLIFILLDKPNQRLDSLLSEHVLALHTTTSKKQNISDNVYSENPSPSTSGSNQYDDPHKPLKERLILSSNKTLNLIPKPLIQKYIAYAKKYVCTQLSPAAAEVLQRFYITLRKEHQTNDSIPITTRQLQAMVRLTLARARMELREFTTERDALDIVEVMRFCLVDTFSDNYQQYFDFTKSQNHFGMNNRSQAKKMLKMLVQYSQKNNNKLSFDITEIKQLAEKANICPTDVYNLVSLLNIQGFLIKTTNQTYKLVLAE